MEGECERLRSLPTHDSDVRFIIFQEEECPTTSRRHYQGFIQLQRAVRRSSVQAKVGEGVNCSPCNGTPADNIRYCSKPDSRVNGPWQAGEVVSTGKRSDLEALREDLRSGQTDAELWESHFGAMARYFKAVDRYRLVLASSKGEDRGPVEVVVWYGATGHGKTRRAYHEAREAGRSLFVVPSVERRASPWFDGYAGQEWVLLDDYCGGYDIHFFKRILDRYPLNVPVKGGFVNWSPSRIIITSNHSPDTWYPDAPPEDLAALRRRYTRVTHFISPWLPPPDREGTPRAEGEGGEAP